MEIKENEYHVIILIIIWKELIFFFQFHLLSNGNLNFHMSSFVISILMTF